MSEIKAQDPVEAKITCYQATTFDMLIKVWLDTLKTIPDETLAASTWNLDVMDSTGTRVLEFSTEVDPGGITIQTLSTLRFLKSATDMNIAVGQYRYLMQRTVGEVVIPYMLGDFVVKKNPNQPPS